MATSSDPSDRRWPQPLGQQLPATARWVTSLPVEVQPFALLQKIPRIANTIARLWHDETELQLYFDDLLIDRRGGRRGFPPDIHHEILMLREYYKGRGGARQQG